MFIKLYPLPPPPPHPAFTAAMIVPFISIFLFPFCPSTPIVFIIVFLLYLPIYLLFQIVIFSSSAPLFSSFYFPYPSPGLL